MKKYFAILSLALTVLDLSAADLSIERERDSLGFTKPIPVSMAGFSGEVDSTLRFDLLFMGFEFVAPDQARYNIQKNSAAGVGAQITDPLARQVIYNKAFTGGGLRQQTHALADDIAKTLTRKPGIAQTRVATKVQPTGIGDGEIWVADYDGHNAAPVTKDNAICAAPAWGGKGLLFYVSYKLANKADILAHNLGTGSRKAVARFPGSNMSPAVSPDGKRLAMILSKSGSPDLWVSDFEGGNLKQLTTTKEDESSPCWSPDGRTICFVSRQSGKPALYTISADGGSMQRLPTSGIANPSEPDWSPDGKYIVFTANMGGFQICVVPMEGPLRGSATTLVAGEDPVWAPNSRAVMFVRNASNRRVLTLLDVPSKQTKDIVRIPGSASQPSWAR
jgi:TolB protein